MMTLMMIQMKVGAGICILRKVSGIHPFTPSLGEGFTPPQDSRPSPRRGVGACYCDFFGNLVALLFCIVFRCLFGSMLAPGSLPTCLPKSTKIQEKSMPRCHPSWTPFFDRFLIDFYSQLRQPESQKSSPRCSESTIFQKIAFRNWHRFLIDFGANLAPFCLQNPPKSFQKSIPRGIKKTIAFCIDFLSIFHRFRRSIWCHVGHFFG